MATFVLVHGAWHGGWCWQRTTPLLRARGHEVYTPTLTGLGERAHLADVGVGLATHVADIVGVIEAEELRDIVLVGHSYGGFVVRGVADRAGGAIRTLVYLDAFVPDDGKRLIDYVPADRRAAFEQMGKAKGAFDPAPLEPFGVTKPEDLAWANPKLRPQPFATFAEPLKLSGALPAMTQVYIRCTDPAFPNFEGFAQRTKADARWTYAEVSGGHDAMISNPRGLADALLRLA
jgi:pimeloyl-ACP methyl ester carboxylesterase